MARGEKKQKNRGRLRVEKIDGQMVEAFWPNSMFVVFVHVFWKFTKQSIRSGTHGISVDRGWNEDK